ncbi:hypothetical protein ES319_A09G018000v1 [Gossypium barbadense]|uniref:Transmembrane protein n=2 Tax=Gossypium TaxID=3633 RepID=A0A5J5U8T8_GOSBA|nr:hypothetical protein ES319_A09G018000v1 [Gossypium barbadense]TYH00992.1 hypothetical protein ES288_A09G021400v1 [Gossypium darwinii]
MQPPQTVVDGGRSTRSLTPFRSMFEDPTPTTAKNQKESVTPFVGFGFNGGETLMYTDDSKLRYTKGQRDCRWPFWCNGAESRASYVSRAHMEARRLRLLGFLYCFMFWAVFWVRFWFWAYKTWFCIWVVVTIEFFDGLGKFRAVQYLFKYKA